MSKKRLAPKVRKEQILASALTVAQAKGYSQMRREDIARHAQVSDALVSAYWGTMPQLRRDVMRHAITQRNVRVLAQGLVANDPQAMKAPEELRLAAAQSLIAD